MLSPIAVTSVMILLWIGILWDLSQRRLLSCKRNIPVLFSLGLDEGIQSESDQGRHLETNLSMNNPEKKEVLQATLDTTQSTPVNNVQNVLSAL